MGRLAQTLYVSNSELIATELTWHLIVQRLRFLETSWSDAHSTSSRSPQHSAHHALGAGRPSFGGRRTCAVSQPPQFSTARILQALAVRQRSYQYPAPQGPSRFLQAGLRFKQRRQFSLGRLFYILAYSCGPPAFAIKCRSQVKLTCAVLSSLRSNLVSLHVSLNARIT